MDVLQKWRPFMALSPSICPLCGKEGESGGHIFLHCESAMKVWNFFRQRLANQFPMPKLIGDLIHQWGSGMGGGKKKAFSKALFQGVVWGLWKERNRRVF